MPGSARPPDRARPRRARAAGRASPAKRRFGERRMTFEIEVNGRMRAVTIERAGSMPARFRVTVDGASRLVDAQRVGDFGVSMLFPESGDASGAVQIAPLSGGGELLGHIGGPTAPRRRWPRRVLRALGVLIAIVAALLVASLTIDLGPALRKRAEVAGSKYLERPMHIGKLSIVLRTGAFEVDDLVIEGLRPTDRPFLKAKRLFVNMPWWSVFSKELIIENVDMNDWEMLVEQFPGRHNFPKIVHESKEPGGPKRFTTTVRSVIAPRGQFTFDDHTVPWSVVCRNLNVHVFRALDAYRGTAQFSNGTVKIQAYDAFRADMQTRFKIDGGTVLLEWISLQSSGASSAITGYVDLA